MTGTMSGYGVHPKLHEQMQQLMRARRAGPTTSGPNVAQGSTAILADANTAQPQTAISAPVPSSVSAPSPLSAPDQQTAQSSERAEGELLARTPSVLSKSAPLEGLAPGVWFPEQHPVLVKSPPAVAEAPDQPQLEGRVPVTESWTEWPTPKVAASAPASMLASRSWTSTRLHMSITTTGTTA